VPNWDGCEACEEAVRVLSCVGYVTKVTYTFHSGPTDFVMLGSGYRLEEAWDACAIRLPSHSYGWLK